MTATSYMIPFVVAGGILFALSVTLSGQAAVPETGWLAKLNQIELLAWLYSFLY